MNSITARAEFMNAVEVQRILFIKFHSEKQKRFYEKLINRYVRLNC